MRKYHPRTATPQRLDYGIELAAGLQTFPETAPLAAPFVELNDRLEEAFLARRAARKPLVVARAMLRVANYQADMQVRSLARASELADGGRRGPLHDALFPDGLAPVVAPAGIPQIAPLQALLARLGTSQVKGVAALLAEWGQKLADALGALTRGASAYEEAKRGYVEAFGKELALRDAHLLAIDSIMGHVRALYPRDRVKQDVLFPEVETPGHGAVEEGQAEGEG